jgi:perosamine synthetase
MYSKVDRSTIAGMCIYQEATIREAMESIGRGELGIAFIVNSTSLEFQGLITDGDIRRALINGIELTDSISKVQRPQSMAVSESETPSEIAEKFSDRIRIIPIVNEQNQIVDVATFDKRVHLPIAEPLLGGNELAYVTDCIVSNWISSSGKYVKMFEENFAKFIGTQYAVATSNGTTALHLAILVSDIGPGDEVIVPSISFIATANAVTYTGATPIFVDIDPQTWTLNPLQLEAAITEKTKAIIPVHLYGHPADMNPILEIAAAHNLTVIEDAAEAHGATYQGRTVGSIGDLAIFSFYGNKIITTGEGGMITTDSKELADKIKVLRDHGMSVTKKYWHPVLGYNYRLTNMQAAVGVAQLEKIDRILEAKLEIARMYNRMLRNIPGIQLPPHEDWAENVYWLYSIVITDEFGISRDSLMEKLTQLGIESRPFFPPMHQQPIYNAGVKLPVSESVSQNGLSLPSSAGMSQQMVQRIAENIIDIQNSI